MKLSRLLTLCFGSAVLAAAACGPAQEEPDASSEFESADAELSGTYRMKNQYSQRCADVEGVSSSNGARIQQWDCGGGTNQQWAAKDLGNGYHQLIAVNSGKCLDVAGVSYDDGAAIQQWSCGGGENQQFRLVGTGAGYQLKARHSGKCVDLSPLSTANGTKFIQRYCKYEGTTTSNSSQRFAFESVGSPPPSGTSGIGGIVSESRFNAWFPNRNSLYTYQGLLSINRVYPSFANSSDMTIRKREAAAFLANISWESDWLKATKEYNTNNYCNYCGNCGCPAGTCSYYGRGPIQLSWDCNYKAAGEAIGRDLLRNPNLVATDGSVAWQTAGWFWNSQYGAGGWGAHAHDAMVNSSGSGGFGATISHINGGLECPSRGGYNTSARDARIARYKSFCDQLGVSYGNNLSC